MRVLGVLSRMARITWECLIPWKRSLQKTINFLYTTEYNYSASLVGSCGFIHSCHKYLLSTYYMPGTILRTKEISFNIVNRNFCPCMTYIALKEEKQIISKTCSFQWIINAMGEISREIKLNEIIYVVGRE